MSIDPSVLDVLRTAIQADPDNTALRLHLASLLVDTGQSGEALQLAQRILGSDPTHREALGVAARAASKLGEEGTAAGYRQLLSALGGSKAGQSLSDQPAADQPTAETPVTETPVAETPVVEESSPPTHSAPEHSVPTDPAIDLVPTPPKATVWDRPKAVENPSTGADQGSDTPRDAKVVPLRVMRGGKEEESDDDLLETETPAVTLADVAGLDQVKRRLNLAFLAPLKNPELMEMYGKSLRGGLMLYGPPGCGKTFLARATAGELGARFMSVGLSDVLDMWMGESEKRIKELFNQARRKAPCVLFFDEIDALGRKRSLVRHSAGLSGVVNQLLAELDGVDARNEGLFVLAATNHPWDVDTALRRPGRLDRTLLVLPPDSSARKGILEKHMAERPTAKLDLDWVVSRTDEYSGADLVHLCDAAAELAMEDSLARGEARPIGQKDFKRSLKEVRASTRPWFEVARNYALYNNEGGSYDDLVAYLRDRRLV